MSRLDLSKNLSTIAKRARAPATSASNVYTAPGSNFSARVKLGMQPWSHSLPIFIPRDAKAPSRMEDVSAAHWDEKWSVEQIRNATSANVMLTWAPSKAKHGLPIITHGEGVYLYTSDNEKLLDWTSQAVCNNLGYTIPTAIKSAVATQLDAVPFVYGGLGLTEVRARLSSLVSEILPPGLTGCLFPSSGSEANEAAISMARRFTGRTKVLSMYRSYHGATANGAAATGDFRRWFQPSQGDYVKVQGPHNILAKLNGESEQEKVVNCLTMLEEQILYEGPSSIACMILESIPGAAGCLTYPDGYLQGIRALADKYNFLIISDEVMMGWGRTGTTWGFQHYTDSSGLGFVPDIVTSAKGLSAGVLPVSMVACSDELLSFFEENSPGYGSTYSNHPVALAAAYETVKHVLEHNVVDKVAAIAPSFRQNMEWLVERHPSILQSRSVGLFGCLDTVKPSGEIPQHGHEGRCDAFSTYLGAMRAEGLIGLCRPPLIHVAPPLVISEEELADGFMRHSRALEVLDRELGF